MGLLSRLQGLFTREPVQSGGSVIPDQQIWSAITSFFGDYSPAFVTQIIREADGGKPKRLIDLVHDIRQKDGHVQGIMTALELAIGELEWTAQPYRGRRDGKPRKADQKLALQVIAALEGCQGWPQAIAHLSGEGELHGHATVELIWGLYDGPEQLLRGWMVPVKAKVVQANRFGFRQADGALLFDAQGLGQVDFGGLDLLEQFPAGKFLQHTPRVNGDHIAREGIDRLLAWYGCFRKWGVKDLLQLAEIGWKPVRIFQYKKSGTGTEDKALAETLARKLTTAGAAAIPDSITPIIEFAKNQQSSGTPLHLAMEEWFGMELSKAVLGHTLVIESGSRGARSLGEVGYKMTDQRKAARALSLAATVNAQLIRPMVEMNVGAKPAPLVLPDLQTEIDLTAFSTAVDVLAKRMRLPASWVREQVRIPEVQGDEEVLTTGATPAGILPDGTLDIPIDVVDPDGPEGPAGDDPEDESPDQPAPKAAPRGRRRK